MSKKQKPTNYDYRKVKICFRKPGITPKFDDFIPPDVDIIEQHKKIEQKACNCLQACIAIFSLGLGFQILYLVSVKYFTFPFTYMLLTPIAVISMGIGFFMVRPHLNRFSAIQFGFTLIAAFLLFGFVTGSITYPGTNQNELDLARLNFYLNI